MKNKLLLQFILISGIFLFGSVAQAQTINGNTIGVSLGHKANYKVQSNEFFYKTDRSYFRYLLTFVNVSDVQITPNYNLKTIIENINNSMDTYKGDVFGTTVLQLPAKGTSDGIIGFEYNNKTWNESTGFLLGTPVTIADWSFWSGFIDSFSKFDNTNHTVTATKSEDNNVFNSSFSLSFSTLPQNITYDGVEKLIFKIETSYNKTSGVLNYEHVYLELGTPIKTILTQNFIFSLTNDSPTTKANSRQVTPGFELFEFIPIITFLALIYYKKRDK